MWHLLNPIFGLALSLGAPLESPPGTDGHIPPVRSEQRNDFSCERIAASIHVRQERDRLRPDQANLATAIRLSLRDLTVNGRRLSDSDIARARSRIESLMRVESVEAVCMGREIELWVVGTSLSAWLESLARTGPDPETTLVAIRLSESGLVSVE